jgi:hypothetical protein
MLAGDHGRCFRPIEASIDHDEKQPVMPKRRWFQYRLKTLFVLPVVVGLLLLLYLYWDNWRRQRPPFQRYDVDQYQAAYKDFIEDVKLDRLDRAYESTSTRFKTQMSRSQFRDLISRYPAVREQRLGCTFHGPQWGKHVPLRNSAVYYEFTNGSDGGVIELYVWVVMDDSFFNRRPPQPQVEEILIQEQDASKRQFGARLPPSWER